MILPSLVILFVSFIFKDATGCNSTCRSNYEQEYLDYLKQHLLSHMDFQEPPTNLTLPKLSPEERDMLFREAAMSDEPEEVFKRIMLFGKGCRNGFIGCYLFRIVPHTLQNSKNISLRVALDVTTTEIDIYDEASLNIDVPISINLRYVYADSVDNLPFIEEIKEVNSEGQITIPLSLTDLQNWHRKRAIGLLIEVAYAGEIGRGKAIPDVSISSQISPVIEIESYQEKPRPRRHGSQCLPSNRNGCCLHDMIVNFAKLGWNFVIGPLQFNAYVCRGECGFLESRKVKNGHAKLLQDGLVLNARCCHPTGFDSMKLIYLRADREIVVTRVPYTIARSCSCA